MTIVMSQVAERKLESASGWPINEVVKKEFIDIWSGAFQLVDRYIIPEN